MRRTTNLTRKLLLVVCVTVIPINALSILVSSLVIMESHAKLAAVYRNDFVTFMNRKDAQINGLGNAYGEFAGTWLNTLTSASGVDSVASIGMISDLGKMLNTNGLKGYVFLSENQPEQRLYVKGSRDLYSQNELDGLKSFLAAAVFHPGNRSAWQIIHLGENFYYSRYYTYRNYVVGFGIDLQAEIGDWLNQIQARNIQLLVSDGQSDLLFSVAQPVTLLDKEKSNQFQTDNRLLRHVTAWQSEIASRNLSIYLAEDESFASIPPLYWLMLIMACLSGFAIYALWRIISRQVISPLSVLQEGMQKLKKNVEEYRISQLAETEDFRFIFKTFNSMADEINQSHAEAILMYQTEITNLRLQVNPHMLLNSLNIIHGLSQSKNFRCIQEFTRHLADYFHYVLRENNTLVRLASEMEFVESYIGIQSIRFPGEFNCRINLPENLGSALVPPLLIENFVENALKYARKNDRIIVIRIDIQMSEDCLSIVIEDDGKGIDPGILQPLSEGVIYIDPMGHRHMGVWNCRRRLQLFFGDNAQLTIQSKSDVGTRVSIRIPYIESMRKIPDEFAAC